MLQMKSELIFFFRGSRVVHVLPFLYQKELGASIAAFDTYFLCFGTFLIFFLILSRYICSVNLQ